MNRRAFFGAIAGAGMVAMVPAAVAGTRVHYGNWLPSSKQAAALRRQEQYLSYTGGRGAGASETLIAWAISEAIKDAFDGATGLTLIYCRNRAYARDIAHRLIEMHRLMMGSPAKPIGSGLNGIRIGGGSILIVPNGYEWRGISDLRRVGVETGAMVANYWPNVPIRFSFYGGTKNEASIGTYRDNPFLSKDKAYCRAMEEFGL